MKLKVKLYEGWNNCKCPVCGKEFHLKPSAVKRFKTHYCSKECQNTARKEYMKGSGNHQYGLTGNKNASWKSDTKISRYGYIQRRVLDHPFRDRDGFMFEHRLVAERYLLNNENSVEINGKRYLSPDFVVHHINFDRRDNSPENLAVMTFEDHQRLHAKLNPRGREEHGRFIKETVTNEIKIRKVTETAIMPQRFSEGATGFDLYADIDKEIIIPPHETVMLSSGIAFQIPKGFFGAIYARSGLSAKQGIRPANCVGVIDSDFRGAVGLPLHNDTNEEKTIMPHERVAQIVFQSTYTPLLVEVKNLGDTDRGANGFGSSGR